ncbi:MAG: sialate O-acetylesterase, partial [Verrucomicrobiota bacterium]
KAPREGQVYPRDVKSNKATVKIAGTVKEVGYQSISLSVTGEGFETHKEEKALTYEGTSARFDFSVSIPAELRNRQFDISLVKAGQAEVIKTVKDVVAGDVYLINGQSNAEARSFRGSANGNRHPFLRSFGARRHHPSVTQDTKWHEANGDINQGPGAVGQWGLRLGRILIDTEKIPIAILNGALGGRPIGHFKRNDNDHYALNTNYGRLLWRVREAGLLNGVRGVLWYQGESDHGNGAVHETGWIQLYKNWKENIPSIERVYVQQLRTGCGVQKWNVDLRDRQRRLPDQFDDISVMSTTGIDKHDGCHYNFEDGYETIGNRTAKLVIRDLYGAPDTGNIEAPNIKKA